MSILPPVISERCCDLGLLVSPQVSEAIQEQVRAPGPSIQWWFAPSRLLCADKSMLTCRRKHMGRASRELSLVSMLLL